MPRVGWSFKKEKMIHYTDEGAARSIHIIE